MLANINKLNRSLEGVVAVSAVLCEGYIGSVVEDWLMGRYLGRQ